MLSGEQAYPATFLPYENPEETTGILSPEQLLKLQSYEYYSRASSLPTAELYEYARTIDSSAPLLLRARALNTVGERAKQGDSDSYNLRQIVPEYFDLNTSPKGNNSPYHWHVRQLAERDKIPLSGFFSSSYAEEMENPDYTDLPDAVPKLPFMLLDKIIGASDSNVRYMSPKLVEDGLRLVLNVGDPKFHEALSGKGHFAEFAKLSRLTRRGGLVHDEPIDYLYEIPQEEGLEYAQVCNRLYDAAARLQDVFPEQVAEQVAHGAQKLIANALFALAEHHKNSKQTNTEIVLKSGYALPVHFVGDEPLQVLQKLTKTFHTLHATTTSETAASVMGVDGKGFSIFRIIDLAIPTSQAVSVQVRKTGAHTFDGTYEYGRLGKGVEASISYMVEETSRLPLLEKRNRSKDVISIRLDREAKEASAEWQYDPASSEGVISLDVGSVLGDENSFGTKVGRLLGWGNSLESAVAGEEAALNHVKTLNQRYGESASFASLAAAVDGRWRSKTLGREALRQLYA